MRSRFQRVVRVIAVSATAVLLATAAAWSAEAAPPVVRRVIPHGPSAIGSTPTGVAVDRGLHRAYVTNRDDGTVSVVDTATDTVSTVIGHGDAGGIGRGPLSVAVDNGAHEAYVVNNLDETVSVIDTISNRVTDLIPAGSHGIGRNPYDVAIDSAMHRAYVSNHDDGTVSAIDTATHTVVTVISVARDVNPGGIAVDDALHRAYVTNYWAGTVAVIDTTNDTLVARIPAGGVLSVGDEPLGIAVDSVAHKAYVTDDLKGTVAVVDTTTNTVVKVIPHETAGAVGIGSRPADVAIDRSTFTAFVTNTGDGTVSVIDTVSDLVTAVIPRDSSTGIGAAPKGVDIDPGTQRGYVVNSSDGTVSAIGIPGTSAVSRIGGPDRYAVAASVSAATFEPGVPTVYIASGQNFPDALSVSTVAGIRHSPVLLVTHDGIPDVVADELKRLRPRTVVIAGGTNTISDSVATALGGYAPVTRVGGADRYAVSAALSATNFTTGAPVAYVASGAVFPDALAGAAAAGHRQGPVLLVTRDGIPDAVAAELDRLRPQKLVVLGGANTISDSTLAALTLHASTGVPVMRVAGADRYAVSAAISADTYPTRAPTVYVASGAVFPDALSGSAAAIVNGAPVLLVTSDDIPDSVESELDRLNPSRIVVLGGPNTVSDVVLRQLGAYIAKV